MATNQSAGTAAIMAIISEARARNGLTFSDMATLIESEYEYRITPDEYRACEQGFTKRVPLDVVIYAGTILHLRLTLAPYNPAVGDY